MKLEKASTLNVEFSADERDMFRKCSDLLQYIAEIIIEENIEDVKIESIPVLLDMNDNLETICNLI